MATVTRKRPPALLLKVGNPVFGWMLSRGWGPTGEVMLLHWNGKKSGKPYSTPVSRFEIDGKRFTTTSSPWKLNFRDGHPADLVLDGTTRAMTGTMVDDPEAVGAGLRSVIDALGDKAKRAMAIRYDAPPSVDDLTDFAKAEGVVLVEFEPTG